MKKKIFMAVIAFALVLCTSIAFVGCGGPKVTAIELATEIKTEYYIGEDLDLDDVLLQVEYEDETYKVIDLEKSMVKGFNTDTVGTRTMTITYEGLICKVQYKVTGPKFTERYYFYYNPNAGFVTCFFKCSDGGYGFGQATMERYLSVEEAWEAFGSGEGLDLPQSFMQALQADGYYCLGADWSELTLKIYSYNHIESSNERGVNIVKDCILYIPEA